MGVQQFFCSHKHKTFKENQKTIKNNIMGNKTAKFKKMFEEIDTGGDGCVSFHELGEFLATDRATAILAELTEEESEIVEEYINENDESENESEAKLTFEQFLELMKENETMQKLILNIAKQKVPK